MENKQQARSPEGSLILRTLAMPSDTNANGDIFGGWIMSQMDMGGAILAKELAQGRVVTVSVDSMSFLRPVSVGDVVCCYGKCTKVGRTSMQVKVEVWIKKVADGGKDRFCVTEALFTFVAIDKNGRPRPIPREDNPDLQAVLAHLEQSTN
ncbi:MAG: acyl-CoA thioester hydrolase YciA [Pasteurellaceae bacterium]|nr:acyl-CoA thioester hydrolase YciA [Pasteurellaceae bacterium]